jgi:hypothetical protein
LKSEYPDKFDVFEKLSVENPVHFYEICIWTLMSNLCFSTKRNNGRKFEIYRKILWISKTG